MNIGRTKLGGISTVSLECAWQGLKHSARDTWHGYFKRDCISVTVLIKYWSQFFSKKIKIFFYVFKICNFSNLSKLSSVFWKFNLEKNLHRKIWIPNLDFRLRMIRFLRLRETEQGQIAWIGARISFSSTWENGANLLHVYALAYFLSPGRSYRRRDYEFKRKESS